MYFTFFGTFGEVVFFFTGDAGNVETLGKADACFTIYINHIVGGSFIILLENSYMQNILSDKSFFCYPNHFHDTRFGKGNDVIKVAALCYEFIFLKRCADKSISKIGIYLCIGNGHCFGLYGIECFYFCFAFPSFSVFFQQVFIICNSKIHQVGEIVFNLFDIGFQAFDLCIQLFNIKPVNSSYRLFS